MLIRWGWGRGNLPKISVVIIFHNMRREAARTLFSLTTEYQKEITASDYEVIAVDSSSTEPLNEEMISACGPQFRYLNIHWEHPSPCKAMNQGIANATHNIILCIIDGARILSPGILRKTLNAFRRFSNPFVYTLGMHLGPKAQSVSILDGYNQSIEDEILENAHWRDNGYRLFSISSVALSSKKGFYSELTESNCFAIYKKTYKKIGEFDERFIMPGGGLINLDFFNRAMEKRNITPVMLMGEATFHQYHGGVATNVPLKEHPWEKFAKEYRRIRGKDYAPVFKKPHYFGEIVPEAAHLCKGDRYQNQD